MNEYLSNFVIASTMILGTLMLIFYLVGQEKVREAMIEFFDKISS